MTAIALKQVHKKYRRPSEALVTTLKSYILRDMWRSAPQGAAKEDVIWALRDVSLIVAEGSTVGIVGRNGSGKSTLLKLIGKILGPDIGSVEVHGRVAALIELGAGFHPELTGRENILINGIILGLTRQQVKARMNDIIAFADIGEFIDYPVRTYSSGMYARLGFGVAMHVDADILLIDEILAVGDADFTRKCHAALQRFKAAGKSIVMVSHSLETIVGWCDHAIWIDGGRVRMSGAPTPVVEAYQKASFAQSAAADELAARRSRVG